MGVRAVRWVVLKFAGSNSSVHILYLVARCDSNHNALRHVVSSDVCDPVNDPGRDKYLVYFHFDPAIKRGYSTEALAGSWNAERLFRLDERGSPSINEPLTLLRKSSHCGRRLFDLKEDTSSADRHKRSGLKFRLGGADCKTEAWYSFRSWGCNLRLGCTARD
jgi:hypothetical protein